MHAWLLFGNLATASQAGGAPRRFSIYTVIFAAMLAAALFFRRKSPNLLLKRADFPIGIPMAAEGFLHVSQLIAYGDKRFEHATPLARALIVAIMAAAWIGIVFSEQEGEQPD